MSRLTQAKDLQVAGMHQFTASDGARIAYEDLGQGQPLVMLHGWSLDHRAFADVSAPLSGHYRVISPDFRGHGMSDSMPPDAGLERLSEDLVQLTEHLALENVVIIAWSMGAMVTWDAWPQMQDRLAACIVVDMVPRLLNDRTWKMGLRDGDDSSVFNRSLAHMETDWGAYTGLLVPRIFAPDAPVELVDATRAIAMGSDPGSMARLWRSMADRDYRPMLGDFNVPTLVINGSRSQLYGAPAADWLAQQLPNAQRAQLERSGHAPMLEEPDSFKQLVVTFVRNLTLDSSPERKSEENHHEPPE